MRNQSNLCMKAVSCLHKMTQSSTLVPPNHRARLSIPDILGMSPTQVLVRTDGLRGPVKTHSEMTIYASRTLIRTRNGPPLTAVTKRHT
jgi:hypothetical protein